MRIIRFIFALLIFGAFPPEFWAQEEIVRPPAEVLESFKRRYPEYEVTQWITSRRGAYKAHFEIGGQFAAAYFAPNGRWGRTSIYLNALPRLIDTYIYETYGFPSIGRMIRSETPKGTRYMVVLTPNSGQEMHQLLFNGEGRILGTRRKPL